MCLAVPLKILSVEGNKARAEAGGVAREIRVDFIPGAAVGDYVIVHAGFAIERITPEAARLALEAWEEVENALR